MTGTNRDIIDVALSIIDRGNTSYLIHPGGGGRDALNASTDGRRYAVDRAAYFTGVPHNNANQKKKTKRKQAQASRRKNRG